MIQLLAEKYKKHIAYSLVFVFYLSMVTPAYSSSTASTVSETGYWPRPVNKVPGDYKFSTVAANPSKKNNRTGNVRGFVSNNKPAVNLATVSKAEIIKSPNKADIDGPSQPEMSSFKAAGTNDMVNLFTGDFSYNIPLLDVGGYPVNIFYDGGIGMEQEASWVGLGWNINPGNVNRNMRGVPDDFNGEEKLIQEQNMKRNITWGVSFGADLELAGIKDTWSQFFEGSVGASIGYSLNNYLGPAIELGVKGTTTFRAAGKNGNEKSPIGVSAGLSANLNSRSGMTLTPNLSLSAKLADGANNLTIGAGISTSYNSRTGINNLHLSSQLSHGYTAVSKKSGKQNSYSIGGSIASTTISFAKPSYTPALRSPVTNSSGAGRFQIGGAMFGVYPSFEVEGYGQVSTIEPADRRLEKPMIGYLYAEKAKNNRDAVMDFSRLNDQEVTPTTTIVSVPQYAYDVFSIQGEGTGGSIRAYRNDNGYVRDNFTASRDKSWSAGADVGIPGHIGGNFNTVKTPSTIGEWNAGNKLRSVTGFANASGANENVYFRNPGENSVLNPNQYDSIGGLDLVRYKLGGSGFSPTIEPKLQKLSASGAVLGEADIQRSVGVPEREKRSQVTSFLTADEASNIGLDKKIKVYNADPAQFINVNDGNKLSITEEINRVSGDRKKHHISQINVTEADGKRYIYGIPVYNTKQKDFSFTVTNNCNDCDLVDFSDNETSSSNSPHLNSTVGGKDGYVQITETPPYAHSFLLSGLLSPDYIDINGDGITEDDIGGAVKFNYSKTGIHKWRTPLVNSSTRFANSNPGNLTESRDDKGIISYGERESWYLHSIESKSMIAFFTLENRADGKGANTQFYGVDYNDNTMKRLKKIDLYNKADLKKNGLAGAKPVKTVHFEYSYGLCSSTPDNQSGGKLTLEKIWFTYNGQRQTSVNKNQYVFSYTKNTSAAPGENPAYEFNASDRWGNYKSYNDNPQVLKNRDYPYAIQNKQKADQNANAWNLKKILLPSGGQIEVEYESDDYAFVQNKKAAVMQEIIGFSNMPSAPTNNLYLVNGNSITENDYIFIKVTESCADRTEVFNKYISGMNQLLVKLLVNMPKGQEYLTAYASISDYDVYTGAGFPAIWIRMQKITDKGKEYSPLSMTAVEYIRERLPAQAFRAYDVTDGNALQQLEQMFEGLAEGINTTFSRIPQYLREKGKAQSVVLNKSFARITDPDGYKYGGGHRVKKVMLKDNWNRMTYQYTSVYGQEYSYAKKEVFNGAERNISSGVASYEPSIGGEENPFQSIVQIANNVPLGPTSYGAIEMPVMDAFFPAPLVGYSQVTVTSIGKKQNPDTVNKKTRSAVGRQVTEFYTAKDFPVYYAHTPLDPSSDKQEHVNPTLNFWYKYAFDGRAISQGFLIATNDMHGKMKSQSSYAENDLNTRINYTENFYRNTGAKGFDDKFDFIHHKLGGEVIPGNMGIDVELMTDTREFLLKSNSFEIQGQVDWMIPFPVIWIAFIWPVSSESENVYRAVTTTKVINYHAVLDSVVVIDKGSQVSTKNLVYDAETGQVVINRTNNEFDKPIYSVNYPAYWAYSGMGPAYRNIDAVYDGVNFLDGRIISGDVPASVFESGDELYIINPGTVAGCDPVMYSTSEERLIWAFDTAKNSGSLTNTTPYFIFLEKSGKPYSRTGVKFRIVRSGKRNMLGAPAASVALMTNPIDPNTHKLNYTTLSKVINSSAVEYKEKWQTDNDVFRKYKTVVINQTTCETAVVEDCTGSFENKINPYVKGLLGNFRGYRNMVFYGDRSETNPLTQTNLPVNGFLSGFSPYWNFNGSNNLVPATTNTKWVWNTEATRFNSKGMELETKDALGIYTAAQYGYKKTLPVAIANNSRFGEMFYEGFEDEGYDDLLNNSAYNSCAVKYIDFGGYEGTEINDAALYGIKAHTGKRVLRIDANDTLIKTMQNPNFGQAYSLNFASDTSRLLYETGGVANCDIGPDGVAGSCNTSFGNLGMYSDFTISSNPAEFEYYATFENLQYTTIQVCALYTFNLEVRISINGDFYNGNGTFNFAILNSDNVVVAEKQLVCQAPVGGGGGGNVYLCNDQISAYLAPGVYKVTTNFNGIFPFYNHAIYYQSSANGEVSYSSNTGSTSYRSLNTLSTCTFTKPIAAKEEFMNPGFGAPPSVKKMVFSAWVRETETNVPAYTTNEVLIDAGSGSTAVLKPSGPIIEGWQRYEGYFTATGGYPIALRLVNNSGQPIYFDDIRIHPFNSNMKSYVYDPVNLRLTSELDANNYASFYEYDEEGTLIRTKVETKQGIKTVTESRSAKQKNITAFE
jgi:hypothetical protein